MLWLAIGLIIFHIHHSLKLLVPNWRQARIDAWGKGMWHGLYSVVSVVTLFLVIYGYSIAWQEADYLYILPQWINHLAALLMAFSFCFLLFSYRPSRLAKITKHPAWAAITIWSIAHLLANGDLASILLFGSFLVWALIHWFAAIKTKAPMPTIAPLIQDVATIIIGLCLWGLFVWKVHYWLFGVSPIA